MLKHHADPAAKLFGLHGKNALTIQQHVPGLRLDQTVEAAQQRRLARTGGADDAGHRARAHRKVDPLQHIQLAIGHAEVLHIETAALEARSGFRIDALCTIEFVDLLEAA